MYRVPTDLDLNEIIGSNVQRICLGPYIVHFDFDSGTNISVEGNITVLDAAEEIAKWDSENRWTSTAFQKLLNSPVTGYSVPCDRLLQIEFENGLSLQFHDSSDQYESFQIYQKERDKMTVV